MRRIHSNSMVGLWLCVIALALAPACSSSNGPVSAGASGALTNKADDDADGKIDESGEGDDEDDDGKVDEANEDADGCAMQTAAAGAPVPDPAALTAVADDADDDDDDADGATDEDEVGHHDSNDDCDGEPADDKGGGKHSDKGHDKGTAGSAADADDK